MQVHRRQWNCPSECLLVFNSSSALESHMKDCHGELFSNLQLPALLDICERPMEPGRISSCALCYESFSLRKLQSHLASHLEELSLFVLPLSGNESPKGSQSKVETNRSEQHQHIGSLSSLSKNSESGIDTPHHLSQETFERFLRSQDQESLEENESQDSQDTHELGNLELLTIYHGEEILNLRGKPSGSDENFVGRDNLQRLPGIVIEQSQPWDVKVGGKLINVAEYVYLTWNRPNEATKNHNMFWLLEPVLEVIRHADVLLGTISYQQFSVYLGSELGSLAGPGIIHKSICTLQRQSWREKLDPSEFIQSTLLQDTNSRRLQSSLLHVLQAWIC